MARHARHGSLDDYQQYDDSYSSAGPRDPYPVSHSGRHGDSSRRRSEQAYHDDRWTSGPRDRPYDPVDSRGPPRGREHRDVRGASEARPGRRIIDQSPESQERSRRGRSEAPRSTAYGAEAPHRRKPEYETAHGRFVPGARSPDRSATRRHSRERSRDGARDTARNHKYPPRAADNRRGRYPHSGGFMSTGGRPVDEDYDDHHFQPPGRARTFSTPLREDERRHDPRHSSPRGRSPPPRSRSRNMSPDLYSRRSPRPGSRPRGPPPRATSMPAQQRRSSPPPQESSKTSTAQKAAAYALFGAAARAALQAGAQTAYKMRNDPSPWVGEKGMRVATAALGAGLVDSFVGTKHSKLKKGGMRHQAMRQAAEVGIRQFVVQPAATHGLHEGRRGRSSGRSADRRRH